jgi:multidrug efflux pump subunit AcrA (membrane-fusion protein)
MCFVLFVAVVAGVVVTRDIWLPWVTPLEEEHKQAAAAKSDIKIVTLSPQAQKNLGMGESQRATLTTYWRTLQVPGIIVDRPGISDRDVPAPAAGVVARIYAYPGDTVRPGDRLTALRLISESLQSTQTELFKTSRETQIVQEQRQRLIESGADKVNPARLLEFDNQLKRLATAAQAYRQELLARGLSPAHLEPIAEGKFVTELEIVAPPAAAEDRELVSTLASNSTSPGEPLAYEVQELKVDLGQQVQAGQTLCTLANHQSLYIEGRSFKREAAYLEEAARRGLPVQVDITGDDAAHWPKLQQTFTIRHLANALDPESRTFAFHIPLINQSRAYVKDAKTHLAWRYRPGQRVRLLVPVEEFGKQDGKDEEKVIVVPTAAVVREGPEAFVFRQSGDNFERRPVHVLFEDRFNVVLKNDGSVRPGTDYLAQAGAASLNRILKAQSATSGLPPGAHFHADGSLHIPGQ